MLQEKTIMLKLTDMLLREKLISPEEKIQVNNLIRAESDVK